MSDLSDADRKSFIDKMTGILQEPENVTLLQGKDWDPTQRATNLANAQKATTTAEGFVSTAEQGRRQATENRRTTLDTTYALASASVASVEGALGKDHDLSLLLHQPRGAMSHASPNPRRPSRETRRERPRPLSRPSGDRPPHGFPPGRPPGAPRRLPGDRRRAPGDAGRRLDPLSHRPGACGHPCTDTGRRTDGKSHRAAPPGRRARATDRLVNPS